jgi:hypothetical protein
MGGSILFITLPVGLRGSSSNIAIDFGTANRGTFSFEYAMRDASVA